MRTYPSLSILFGALLASCGNGDGDADAHGNFEAVETLVSAKGSGELLDFRVEEGMTLEAGASVGTIDTVMLALQTAQVDAERAATGSRAGDLAAQFAVQDARIADLQREEERLTRLVAGKAATQKQLDDIRGQIAIQRRQLSALEAQNPTITAQVRALDARIALLRRQIDDQHVINPVHGTVVAKLAEPHELVAPGRPLYRLAAMDTLELRAYISGGRLGGIRTGSAVEVGIDGSDGAIVRLPGRVSWISSEAEFTPKTIQTREERVDLVYAFKVRVANTDGVLKSGMPGEVYLEDVNP
ncbi:MAG TPA: HlyD family efflux transporter periplasmic adaptor subunit [Flavobacteriales bacterium]|nr:HlyD family efflux transporter periplasmic adaptor subunit [Flavobacteriales bacterium]